MIAQRPGFVKSCQEICSNKGAVLTCRSVSVFARRTGCHSSVGLSVCLPRPAAGQLGAFELLSEVTMQNSGGHSHFTRLGQMPGHLGRSGLQCFGTDPVQSLPNYSNGIIHLSTILLPPLPTPLLSTGRRTVHELDHVPRMGHTYRSLTLILSSMAAALSVRLSLERTMMSRLDFG